MEAEQIETRLAWLDEQRRKDADTLSRAWSKLEGFEDSITQQSQQIQDLASEIARLTALSGRISQFDEALTKHRQEISRQLEGTAKRREEMTHRMEEMRKSDQEKTAKAMDELRALMSPLDEIQLNLATHREEAMRLSRDQNALEKRLDELSSKDEELGRSILSLDETHKHYNRRISDLQAETTDLRARADTLRGLIDTSDDQVRRLDTKVSELAASESEQREAQVLWTEQQSLKIADFERGWKEWSDQVVGFDEKAAEFDERMLSYAETYRKLRQLQDDLENLFERLERRINEIIEMQRLGEDRIRQEWTNFQADDQKRWNTHKLTTDEHWREHDRLHEKLTIELRALDENVAEVSRAIVEIGQTSNQRIMDLMAVVREWAAEVETMRGES